MARSISRKGTHSRLEVKGKDLKRQKEVRLIKVAIAITSVYMLVELVVGYTFNALVLVADAYHMLTDLVAFIVQLYADEIGGLKREHDQDSTGFTYGFSRVAFVANLINGVILLALCLTLGLESMQRLYSPETMTLPPLVAGLGFLALIWNVIMFFMFNEAHEHGQEKEISFCHPSRFRRKMIEAGESAPQYLLGKSSPRRANPISNSPNSGQNHAQNESHDALLGESSVKEHRSALAIHAITDAAGNIAVIIDGLISLGFGPKIGKVSGLIKPWVGIGFVDPLASLVVTYVILLHSFPLVTASSYALMQAFDPQRTKRIRRILQTQTWLPSSISKHLYVKLIDFHLWSLSKEDHVATLKFSVSSLHHETSPVLSDLQPIEEAAKAVLARAKVRRDVTVEITFEDSTARQSSDYRLMDDGGGEASRQISSIRARSPSYPRRMSMTRP
ncbi:hypothetical protein JCM5353_004601 [Sporobolomyces roseus]